MQLLNSSILNCSLRSAYPDDDAVPFVFFLLLSLSAEQKKKKRLGECTKKKIMKKNKAVGRKEKSGHLHAERNDTQKRNKSLLPSLMKLLFFSLCY